MIIFAVDAGGTKARFAAYDQDGIVLHEFEHASCHPLQVGFKIMAQRLAQGIQQLMENVNQKPDVLSFGLAGYGQNASIRASIERVIHTTFKDYKTIIHNDVECALKASLQSADGIMVVAGTGSIALRSLNHTQVRSGGWGSQIGDEGSAFWMGRYVLSIFSQMADGRLPKTELYDLVMETLVLDEPTDIIVHLNDHPHPKEATASLARIAYLAYQKGDKQCIQIFEDAAFELAKLVRCLHYESPSTIPVKCTGGVFEAKEAILKPLKHLLGKEYTVELSQNPPIYGAYLFAKQALGEME